MRLGPYVFGRSVFGRYVFGRFVDAPNIRYLMYLLDPDLHFEAGSGGKLKADPCEPGSETLLAGGQTYMDLTLRAVLQGGEFLVGFQLCLFKFGQGGD